MPTMNEYLSMAEGRKQGVVALLEDRLNTALGNESRDATGCRVELRRLDFAIEDLKSKANPFTSFQRAKRGYFVVKVTSERGMGRQRSAFPDVDGGYPTKPLAAIAVNKANAAERGTGRVFILSPNNPLEA